MSVSNPIGSQLVSEAKVFVVHQESSLVGCVGMAVRLFGSGPSAQVRDMTFYLDELVILLV